MSRVVDRIVLFGKSDGVPSLAHLGVDVGSAAQIGIDLGENGNVDFVNVHLQGVVEDYLQVAVVSVVLFVVGRRAGARESDVLLCQFLSLVRLRSREVELDWGKTWDVEPLRPVN